MRSQVRLEGDRCGLKLSVRVGRLYGQFWYWTGLMYRSGTIKQRWMRVRRLRPGVMVQIVRLYGGVGIMSAAEARWNWYGAGWRYYPPEDIQPASTMPAANDAAPSSSSAATTAATRPTSPPTR